MGISRMQKPVVPNPGMAIDPGQQMAPTPGQMMDPGQMMMPDASQQMAPGAGMNAANPSLSGVMQRHWEHR